MVECIQLGSVRTPRTRRVFSLTANRIVSLEIGKPMMISDADCDVGDPAPVDDDCIRPEGIVASHPGAMTPNGLLSVIPVARIYAELQRIVRRRVVADETLATCDQHFQSIMESYPEPFPIQSNAYLDPRLLTAACALQTARFFLYRHNLSPACRKDVRKAALDRCVSVAKDTAHYIQRSMRQPSSPSNLGHYPPEHMAAWAARLRTMAPAFYCSHLWRCTLILCLRMDFSSALTIVHASAGIGDLRKNNTACGRYLAFFLDKLVNRLRSGSTEASLENDEEMLAYASGDLQGSGEEAWVWSEGQGTANRQSTNSNSFTANSTFADAKSPSTLTEREMHEWGGWEQIQHTLTQLAHGQQNQYPPPSSRVQHFPLAPAPYPGHSQTPTQHLAPQRPPSAHTPVSPGGSNGGGGGSSRISIKDIM